MLSWISRDYTAIILIVSFNTESLVGGEVDEGVSGLIVVVVDVDVEELVGCGMVVLNDEFVGAFLKGECFLSVHDADNLVGDGGARFKVEVILSFHQ